jgi:stearoyl-CoA desaturase (delta-9 desaturase)
MAEADRLFGTVKADEMVKDVSDLPVWTRGETMRRHGEWDGKRRRVLLLLEGCIVDVGGYLEDHVSRPARQASKVIKLTMQPGGEALLLSHCVTPLPSSSASSSSSYSSDGDQSDTSNIDSGYASGSSTRKRNTHSEDLDSEIHLRDATRSFFGGMNNHSGAAREMMRCLRVARLSDGDMVKDN